MKYIIKKFNKLSNTELYDMIRLREEVFVVEQDCVYLDCDGKDKMSDHLLLKDGEKIVGTLRMIPAGISYEELSIGRVVLMKEYRKKGLAEKMMKAAIDYMEEKYGKGDIVLSAQVVIKSLYTRVGFEEISEVYLEDGIDHVKMIKRGL
jgi:ElaA protein